MSNFLTAYCIANYPTGVEWVGAGVSTKLAMLCIQTEVAFDTSWTTYQDVLTALGADANPIAVGSMGTNRTDASGIADADPTVLGENREGTINQIYTFYVSDPDSDDFTQFFLLAYIDTLDDDSPVLCDVDEGGDGHVTITWSNTSDHIWNTGTNAVPGPVSVIFSPPALDPPTAAFTADISEGPAPLVVNFDASTSTEGSASISSYEWDFGDGETDSGATVTHTFTNIGPYTVTLTVTDTNSLTDTATHDIIVDGIGVSPHFTTMIDPSTPGLVQFDPSTTFISGVSVSSYRWDYGDGDDDDILTDISTTITGHTYALPDTYTITLTVYDDAATPVAYSISHSLVYAGILVPGFTESRDTVNHSPVYVFDPGDTYDTIPGTQRLEAISPGSGLFYVTGVYVFDFGDGSPTASSTFTSEGDPRPLVTHSFDELGTYEISLTVTDNSITRDPATETDVESVVIDFVGILFVTFDASSAPNRLLSVAPASQGAPYSIGMIPIRGL